MTDAARTEAVAEKNPTTLLTQPGLLFNPRIHDFAEFDPATRRILKATIDFFENRGKKVLKEHHRDRVWYTDYLDMVERERIYALLGTPAAEADGDPDKRWDTSRISAFNEIGGFYGTQYWYSWAVSSLGLAVIWQSDNAVARKRAAEELERGGIIGFGMSEKEHGADIYSTDMLLTPDGDGGFRATGGKYYIGNGNVARIIPVFGRRTDIEGPDAYIWFTVDSRHPDYKLVKNVVEGQAFVSAFDLADYPVGADDVLHTGKAAFHVALNAVNVGKFNVGYGCIGLCEHSFYETINHSSQRILFGHPVTGFPHVRQLLTDAYARLVAMKLFSARAIDYMRSASPDDRRYLLFNSLEKMKVTREGVQVMTQLMDVISARGMEKDTFFEMACQWIQAYPRIEGTAHVNMALTLKFMAGYLFNQIEYDPIPVRREPADDEFLFRQGPAKGMSQVGFAPWRPVFEEFSKVPNVACFLEQADGLGTVLMTAPPTAEQQKDLDFLLAVGDIFILLPYAQLILEQAKIAEIDLDVVDQIFEALVRDFSTYVLVLHGKSASTEAQQAWALEQIRKPVVDDERFARVFAQVHALAGTYEMNP